MIPIGVDIDGVISNTPQHVCDEAKRRWGIDIKVSDITKHKIEDVTPITDAQAKEMFNDPDFYDTVPVLDGAKEFLEALKEKYTIHLVTSRPSDCMYKTIEWLNRNKLSWTFMMHQKDKAKYAVDRGIEYFVEDSWENAISLSKACTAVFLIDWPYNCGAIYENIWRVFTHGEILNMLGAE